MFFFGGGESRGEGTQGLTRVGGKAAPFGQDITKETVRISENGF